MEFRHDQAIYLQIADMICENILSGRWKPGDRVPSIRELAVSIEVNPNTVMRTYGFLQEQGIIQNQRGIGYFTAEEAYKTTKELARRTFVNRELPRIFKTMDLLGMSLEDLAELHAARSEGAAKTSAVGGTAAGTTPTEERQ
jgi:GntR family transcriptional regulator